jgi:hypothetical protein
MLLEPTVGAPPFTSPQQVAVKKPIYTTLLLLADLRILGKVAAEQKQPFRPCIFYITEAAITTTSRGHNISHSIDTTYINDQSQVQELCANEVANVCIRHTAALIVLAEQPGDSHHSGCSGSDF